jgi:hypothetical protein
MVIPNLEAKLKIKFHKKPLLIGGMAMEYYGLRKSGMDVDFVLNRADHKKLENKLKKEELVYLKGKHVQEFKKTPEFVDLFGDKGILFHEFEIWTCILKFDYEYLAQGAVELQHCKIISLEKLLFLKALVVDQEKYLNDVKLIGKKIISNQYK